MRPADDLTTRLFRALYQEYDLRTLGSSYVVVPKGTPCFTGSSLGEIARQISNHPAPEQAGMPSPAPRPGPADPG